MLPFRSSFFVALPDSLRSFHFAGKYFLPEMVLNGEKVGTFLGPKFAHLCNWVDCDCECVDRVLKLCRTQERMRTRRDLNFEQTEIV